MITNGTVKYTLPASYTDDRHGVEITLAFNYEDGDTATLERAGTLARSTAINLRLGKPIAPAPLEQSVAEAVPPTKRQSPKAADIVIPASANPPVGASAPQTVTELAPAASASTVNGTAVAPPTQSVAPAAGVETAAASVATVEITDMNLMEACGRENARLLAKAKAAGQEFEPGVAIKAVIAELVGPPPSGAKDIPQAQRALFLQRLAAL